MRIVRFVSALAAVLLVLAAAPSTVRAAGPSADELEAAKESFLKGKELYDKGDKKAAVEEFKQSYRLSKNPVLLYNIGLVYDELGEKALALHYYQKFLAEAPDNEKTTANKGLATGRVDVLKKELSSEDLGEPTPTKPPEPVKPPEPKPAPSDGTLQKSGVTEFTHVTVDEAPPAKPLDLTVKIPDDSHDWKLTLYYRPQGQDEFIAVRMKPRYDELVGRIPAKAVKGTSLQYYIEAKDAAGAMAKRSGSPGSPNIVYLEKGAAPHFYRDLEPLDKPRATPAAEPDPDEAEIDDDGGNSDAEDPLKRKQEQARKDKAEDDGHEDSSDLVGPVDGGGPSKTRTYLRWGTTGGAVVLLGAATFFYFNAKAFASEVESESTSCGTPPCADYDGYVADLEATGKSRQTMANVTFFAGLGLAAVAGYFWYADVIAAKPAKADVRKKKAPADEDGGEGDESMDDSASRGIRFVGAAPVVGADFIGASAVIAF